MAPLAPLPQQWVLPPPTIATSSFSPGGAFYPTPQNNYNYGAPIGTSQSSSGTGLGSPTDLVSNAQTLGSFAKNGFSLPQSSFVNNLGAGLGFAPGSLSYTAAGALPWQTAGAIANPAMAGTAGVSATTGTSSMLGASTLSSTLGAAGIGALAGSFLGKIGGNSTGGSIGGAIGAGAGMAGAFSAIGLAGGPVGAIVGGLVGGIAGGFFGGSKKPTATYQDQLTSSPNGVDVLSNTGKNGGSVAPAVQSFNKQLSNATKDAYNYLKPLGIDISGFGVVNGYNTLYSPTGTGGYTYVGINTPQNTKNYSDELIGWSADDPDSQQAAISKAVATMASRAGASQEQINQMVQQLAINSTPQGQAYNSQPIVPVTGAQFEAYMTKYKTQDTTNAQPTTPAPTV